MEKSEATSSSQVSASNSSVSFIEPEEAPGEPLSFVHFSRQPKFYETTDTHVTAETSIRKYYDENSGIYTVYWKKQPKRNKYNQCTYMKVS